MWRYDRATVCLLCRPTSFLPPHLPVALCRGICFVNLRSLRPLATNCLWMLLSLVGMPSMAAMWFMVSLLLPRMSPVAFRSAWYWCFFIVSSCLIFAFSLLCRRRHASDGVPRALDLPHGWFLLNRYPPLSPYWFKLFDVVELTAQEYIL